MLAAAAYFFPLGLALLIYERRAPDYFLRYHAIQALITNGVSVAIFLAPVALAALITPQPEANWPLGVHMIIGVGLSLLLLLLFGLYCYCVVQAYLGRYTVLPRITGWTYAWLERQGG